jgi:hypothetical protein
VAKSVREFSLSHGLRPIKGVERNLLLSHLFWFADRAALEAMDQSLPPGPGLFLGLMLILQPSRLGQLFSNFWVTYPHTKPLSILTGRSISSATQSAQAFESRSTVANILSSTLCRLVAAMPECFGITVASRRLQSEPTHEHSPINKLALCRAPVKWGTKILQQY